MESKSVDLQLSDKESDDSIDKVRPIDPSLIVRNEPTFVGREDQLIDLLGCLEEARHGNGGIVSIPASSGFGKSRLLEEFSRRALTQNVLVLSGGASSQSAARPCEILVDMSKKIVDLAREDLVLLEQLDQGVNQHKDALVGVLPEFETVFEVGKNAKLGPEDFGEERSLRALLALLDAVGSPGRPAVVLLDDCQWADDLALRLLKSWSDARAMSKQCFTMLVISYRSEEVSEDHPINALSFQKSVELPIFCDRELRYMLMSVAGHISDEALEQVQQISNGNPFLAIAVFRALTESGTFLRVRDRWEINEGSLSGAERSEETNKLLSERIRLLGSDGAKFLKTASIVGKEFELSLVSEISELSSSQTEKVVTEAERRYLIREIAPGKYSFVHDKLRESALEMFDDDERADLHGKAACVIEKLRSDQIFQLAFHFDAAGASYRALQYAQRAAEEARARHSLQIAEDQYRIALKGITEQPRSTQFVIYEGFADVLMLRGKYLEAQDGYGLAKDLASDSVESARLDLKLGELLFKKGEMPEAATVLIRGLGRLGEKAPIENFKMWRSLIRESIVWMGHVLMPTLFLRERGREPLPSEVLIVQMLQRLAYVHWFAHGKYHLLRAVLRGMNLSESYGATGVAAHFYSSMGPVLTTVPLYEQGLRYVERSLHLRRELKDLWGEGQSLHFYGVTLYAASKWSECIDKCLEAMRILEQTGDRWESVMANCHVAYSLYRLGSLDEAEKLSKEISQEANEIGDLMSAGVGLYIWSVTSGGEVPEAQIEKVLDLTRTYHDVQTRVESSRAAAVCFLARGEVARAIELLEDAWKTMKENSMSQEYVQATLPWLATALRVRAQSCSAENKAETKKLLNHAWKIVGVAIGQTRKYQNNLPHSLREKALLASMRGKQRLARQTIEECLEISKRQGAHHEHALALIARGAIGENFAWAGSKNDRREGEAALERLGANVDFSKRIIYTQP